MKSKRFFSGPFLAILVLTAILVSFFSVEFIRLKNQGPTGSMPQTTQVTQASSSTTAATTATTAATAASAIAATPSPATDTEPAVTSAAAPTGAMTAAPTAAPTGATTALTSTTTRIAVRLITPEQAQAIAMDEIGKNAKLLSIKSELDNHPPKYDVTLTMGGYVYELEIHAVTGAIIDFEKDPMDDRGETTRPH